LCDICQKQTKGFSMPSVEPVTQCVLVSVQL